ncbi:apolipoprotein N-acyltransferase [Methyloceanibacter sp.]|uniref:apolipoprotein N-acyltransferase n=1 Tax=Methyloceanibacter sp. TaxID=1965321 RepID=UPI003D6D2B83
MLLTSVQAAADRVAALKGGKRALLAVFAGAISVLAFAPLHVWPVLFLSFGPLVWLLDGCHAGHARLGMRLRCAALTGFWFGFGYFLTGLYWTAEAFLIEPWRHGWLIPFAMTGLAGGMALFYAAAAALAAVLWRPGAARVFALAIAFGLAEFARGHVLTGLPWNLVGYGLAATLPMMQAASIFGVYALSLLALLLFASPFAIWAPQGSGLARRKGTALVALFFSVALAVGAMWGEERMANAGAGTTVVKLRIVQANVDQASKWRPENSEEIFNTYLDLTKSGGGAGGLDGVTLVVWPETAVPFLLADSSEALNAIADVLPEGTSLLVGSARVVAERDADGRLAAERVYNSLIVVGDEGQILGSYDKVHLVPFGEYLPFQDFMESLGFLQLTGIRGGFSAGTGPRLLSIPGAPPARPLICYEIIFPDEVADSSQRAGWFLNVTNDAWFGTSAGPYQHFHQAQLRAVEQGLPVVRAANTGISAIIDPYGRVLGELGLKKEGVVDGLLPEALPITKFVMCGRWIELAVLTFALLGYLAFSLPVGKPKWALA